MNTAVLTGRQVLFDMFLGIYECLAHPFLNVLLTGVPTDEDLHSVGGGQDS